MGAWQMTSNKLLRACLLLTTPLGVAAGLSASALAQTAPAPAPAPTPTPAPSSTAATDDKPVKTFSGSLTPYVGNIRTFTGDVGSSVGNIRTFSGDLSPYIGNIRTFGDINPYIGNIRTFWGDLAPQAGELDPMIGNIRTFSDAYLVSSKDTLTYWLNIRTFGEAPDDYLTLSSKIAGIIGQAKAAWGAQVQARTGKSFEEGFVAPMLAKYGIDLTRPESLAGLDAYGRQMFFLDWYDQLTEFSGMNHVDHWMKTVNWSPSITKTIGEGRRSVIGLLDFTVTGDGAQNITKYDGISTFSNGHGAAVASLMIAAHDGKGVMGMAPMASVVAYNPFDSSGTANWTDVRNGVLMLAQNHASIVNMSLGEPGWTLPQGWNGVFGDAAVSEYAKKTVFVLAAGNDGIAQTKNVVWDKSNPYLIVVGSVGPGGTISPFSNQPGDACLVKADGSCDSKMKLMNRFITAPGEMILVSDGMGGVMRVSGTSFAAPLVSGTVALLHDRWPWLANYPKESVDIILKSARDAGAPGVDPVYGWGILDVTAALSPLSFAGLKWYQYDSSGQIISTQASKIRDPKEQAKWEASGMFFYAYEDIGNTFRDFAIPVSSKLVDGTSISVNGGNLLQTYIYTRYLAWVSAGGGSNSGSGFANFGYSAPLPTRSGLQISVGVAPRTQALGFRQGNIPYQTAVRVDAPGERVSFTFGEGDGAVVLGDGSFGVPSDFDPATGGANPLMGYASGGAYMGTQIRLDSNWTLSAGLTQRVLRRDLRQLDMLSQFALGAVDPYKAGSQYVSLRYGGDGAAVTGTYTRLRERNSLLGIQSLDPNDFASGSTSEGASIAADLHLSPTLSVAATGTLSRTRTPNGSSISPSSGGLVSSSFQMGITKSSLFGRSDLARLTFAQPMHLERGTVDLTTVQVVNRQTGELGPVTQRFSLGIPQRQYVSELMYGRTMLDGAAQLSVFGRVTLNGGETDLLPRATGGATFRLAF